MTRILLVEDDRAVRDLLYRQLTDAGYDVEVAEDGTDGLKIYRDQQPDLVVTDIIMPEMEGIQMMRELRRESPDVRVIAISGGGRGSADTYLQLAARMGAKSTLEKPVRQDTLLAAVEDALSGEECESCSKV